MSSSEVSDNFDDTFSGTFLAVLSGMLEPVYRSHHLGFSSARLLHMTSLG
jgi:hypothetical protein